VSWGIAIEVQRDIASADCAVGIWMSAIHDVDVDLATFCGRIGNLYVRHGLCPPFALHDAVQGWMARDIPLSHCVDVIVRYLGRSAGSHYSGSGDRNFAWLSGLIETSWYERSFARQPRSAPKQIRHNDWLDEYGAEELNQRAGRKAAFTAGLPNQNSEPDSFEPDAATLREKAAGACSPTRQTKSASGEQIVQPQPSASRLSRQTQAPSPKKIDMAVDWLRAQLATGEQVAAKIEAKARSVGIAPRTYDRAPRCLGITSRRIGFGRKTKYMMALPVVHATPSAASIKAGAT
jgi:hypothetical protein